MFGPAYSPGEIAATLLGSSEAADEVRQNTELAAGVDARVMLAGEYGVGKRRIAQSIHRHSIHCQAPFIAVRCTDRLPLDVEIGPIGNGCNIRGALERADGGTLFLQELDSLTPELQGRLMDFLANGPRNVRIISATTTRLLDKVNNGGFRSDLYYLLNQILIQVPPLRARAEDVEPLLEFFTAYYARRRGLRPPTLSVESRLACRMYHWPGNLRQLQAAAGMFVSPGRRVAREGLTVRLLRKTEYQYLTPA